LLEFDGLEVVHDGKDSLLHLTSVFGTENDHFHSLEIDLDRGGGGHTGRESIGGELTSIVDDEIGFTKVGEFFGSRSDQHVVLVGQSWSPVG
jgi:hypothetical protein